MICCVCRASGAKIREGVYEAEPHFLMHTAGGGRNKLTTPVSVPSDNIETSESWRKRTQDRLELLVDALWALKSHRILSSRVERAAGTCQEEVQAGGTRLGFLDVFSWTS